MLINVVVHLVRRSLGVGGRSLLALVVVLCARSAFAQASSTVLQSRFEFAPETVTPMLPQIPLGNPGLRVISVQ